LTTLEMMMDSSKKKERTTLFVGDLSTVCSENDLTAAFSNFGIVLQVRIQRNRMTMASMAYGFVRMSTPLEAINAKNALDGSLLCGRKLRVREAEYGVGGADKGFLRKYSLYIKFESIEEGKKTNEMRIREIFSKYGDVSDISLRKMFFDKVNHPFVDTPRSFLIRFATCIIVFSTLVSRKVMDLFIFRILLKEFRHHLT
jgi:RNA recognition motif-containing protein